MAAVKAIVITSSPPFGHFSRTVFQPSHSESVSPPSRFFSAVVPKKRAACNVALGSRAAPIPDAVVIGFRSANAFAKELDTTVHNGSTSRSCMAIPNHEDALPNVNDQSGLQATEAKPVKEASDAETTSKKKSTIRKTKNSNLQTPKKSDIPAAAFDNDTKDLAQPDLEHQPQPKSRKPRKKKDTTDVLPRSIKGKITKPGVNPAFGLKEFLQPPILDPTKSCDDIAPSQAVTLCRSEDLAIENGHEKPLDLDPALKRRDLLTPLRNIEAQLEDFIGNIRQETHDKEINNEKILTGSIMPLPFPNLEGQFGYTIKAPTGESVSTVIDQVVPVMENKKPAVKRVRPPAKSSRTITRIAIANLNSPEKSKVESPISLHSLLEPQPLKEFTEVSETNQASDAKKVRGRKTKAISTSKQPKIAKRNNKKVIINVPKLLSPSTAMRRIARQGLFFGTCSQITKEESPSFIRDLHQAIKESESTLPDESIAPSVAHRVQNLRAFIADRRLWFAASRDDDEHLLPIETVEERQQNLLPIDVDQQNRSKVAEFLDIDTIIEEQPEAQFHDANFVHIDDIQQTSGNITKGEQSTTSCLQTTISSSDYDRTSNLLDRQTPILKLSTAKSQARKMIQCLETFGSAEIKPFHSRVLQPLAVNTTLKKACREDEVKAVIPPPKRKRATKVTTEISNARPSSEEMGKTAAKKPRGRPRKDLNLFSPPPKAQKSIDNSDSSMAPLKTKNPRKLAKKWASIDEIEDSEPEPTSSPRRRRSTVPLPALELSHPLSVQGSSLDNEAVQSCLFAQITKAVKSMPRTKDPAHPSWFEKMLMYDPIVLEDLTAWLNAGALNELGEREEKTDIKASVVQKWCEENSICCLWREGLRGGVKARY